MKDTLHPSPHQSGPFPQYLYFSRLSSSTRNASLISPPFPIVVSWIHFSSRSRCYFARARDKCHSKCSDLGDRETFPLPVSCRSSEKADFHSGKCGRNWGHVRFPGLMRNYFSECCYESSWWGARKGRKKDDWNMASKLFFSLIPRRLHGGNEAWDRPSDIFIRINAH